MPTILLQRDINKAQRRKIAKPPNMRDVRAQVYARPEWRALRLSYLSAHPLDELSLLTDKVEAAEDVHHLISPFETCSNLADLLTLLLDSDNLISLSKVHHGYIHGNPQRLTDAEREHLQARITALKEKYHDAI